MCVCVVLCVVLCDVLYVRFVLFVFVCFVLFDYYFFDGQKLRRDLDGRDVVVQIARDKGDVLEKRIAVFAYSGEKHCLNR